MSDFSEAYGLFFVGLVIVLLFLTSYKIVENNHSLIENSLASDYLASKFKDDLKEYDSSMNYNRTFALPRFDAFKNSIIEVIIYE